MLLILYVCLCSNSTTPLELIGLGFSGNTGPPGSYIEAELVAFYSLSEMQSISDEAKEALKGKIVLINEHYEGYGKTVGTRYMAPKLIKEMGGVACLIRTVGTHATGGNTRSFMHIATNTIAQISDSYIHININTYWIDDLTSTHTDHTFSKFAITYLIITHTHTHTHTHEYIHKGPFGIRSPHTGSSMRGVNFPAAALSIEDTNRLQRIYDRSLKGGEKPVVRLVMDGHVDEGTYKLYQMCHVKS